MSGYRPGMLDDLEAGPGIGLSAPPIGLSTAPIGLSAPPAAAAPKAATPAKPRNAKVSRVAKPAASAAVEAAAVAAPRKPRRGRPPLPPTDRPQTRPTNVMVPSSTLDLVASAREKLSMSTGELIVVAIEAELEKLPALLGVQRPRGLFETRASRLPHRSDEPERPLSYRLTPSDLATIDQLVDQFGARSRGHLISVALNAHFT